MPDEKPRTPEQVKALHGEMKTDYEAARLRDGGQDYEAYLKAATEKAKGRMQGKDKGRER